MPNIMPNILLQLLLLIPHYFAPGFSLLQSSISTIDPSKLNKSRSDPYSYIDEMYEKYLTYQEDALYDGRGSSRTTWPNGSFCAEYLSEEEQYQLGATALDCSIMITFRRLSGAEESR